MLLFCVGVDSDRVTLKGSKECIELAIARIKEIVHELDSQVTIECVISQRHHRTVMGSRGVKVYIGIINTFPPPLSISLYIT